MRANKFHLVAVICLISVCTFSQQNKEADEAFLGSFYKNYFQQRMSVGWGSTDPEEYFRVEQTLIQGNEGIISVRNKLGFLSTASDRAVGFILAIPNSPGKISQLMSLLSAASETKGLLEDFGLASVGSAENWLYEANTYVGLLSNASEARKSLDVIYQIRDLKTLIEVSDAGLKAADVKKLANVKMFGVAVADFILDKSIAASVRQQLRTDKLKAMLLSTRYTQACELERLYRKAKYKTLSWFDAFRLMQIEGQYFARRAECYLLDEMFWDDQLNPKTWKIPYTSKTLKDLMPGYDNPEQEKANLEYSRQQAQNSRWHLKQCTDFFDAAMKEWETSLRDQALVDMGVAPQSSVESNQNQSTETSNDTFRRAENANSATNKMYSSQIVMFPDASHQFAIHPGGSDATINRTISELLFKIYPDAVIPRTIPKPFNASFERYKKGIYFSQKASEKVIKQNLSQPAFGFSKQKNSYVYVHLNYPQNYPSGLSQDQYYDRYGFDFVVQVVVGYAQANLDDDPEREFVLILYQDEEELPTNGWALDRHSVVIADIVGSSSSEVPPVKIYKTGFYAGQVINLQVHDTNRGGKPKIFVIDKIGNEQQLHQFSFESKKLSKIE